MDIDRDTLVEVVISSVSVLLMIGAMAFIGMNYSEDNALTTQGGTAFVGAIVLFVFVMLGIGYWFANYKAKQGGDDANGDANGA